MYKAARIERCAIMITSIHGCLALTAVVSLWVSPACAVEFVTNHWYVTLKEPLSTEQVRDLVKGKGFSVVNQVSD